MGDTALTASRLAQLETVIEQGLSTFLDVGNALLEVRESRLYEETHLTFDAYCRERWKMRREVADRYVRSAEVHAAVNPMGLAAPTNERQTRELAPLLAEPDQLREAWAEVVSLHPKPTAAQVREVVEKHRPQHSMPLDEEILARQQRENLITSLDRAIESLEGPPSMATAEAKRLLIAGDAGPFTPSRFDRVAAYATAWAQALREAGVDG